MKKIIVFIIPIVLAYGCKPATSFKITGKINEKTKDYIYLNRINVNALAFIDSAKVKGNGKFFFKTKTRDPDFFQIGFSETDFITILASPGENIKINFKGKNLYQDYEISGSEGSEQVKMLDEQLSKARIKLDSLKTEYNAASKTDEFDEKGPKIEAEFNNTLKAIRKKNIEFIISHTRSMASLKALYQKIDDKTYVLYDPKDLQYLKIISDSLGKYYPNSRHVQALTEDLKKELSQLYSQRIENMADTLPEVKLDPILQDINGRRIALSSLKGKVVLLTFWSVQSKECIAENLQLKEVYRAYNKKGFEIYQINLDENEDLWRQEVRFDELPWINTREDDPSNPVNARLFNVKALPTNYLFGRDGTIIGKDLHGRYLQIKLNQLFAN
jgi:thiol-disulfide isomerase/thioredoxin